MLVLPSLLQTFKGFLPHQLLEIYNQKGGQHALAYDLEVALEIQNQREDALSSSKDGNRMANRLKQKRHSRKQAETINEGDLFEMLKEKGMVDE
tara:strand:- start:121 stop:402 length:282 start_codon:yes stop_codon:yes gene_type:complete